MGDRAPLVSSNVKSVVRKPSLSGARVRYANIRLGCKSIPGKCTVEAVTGGGAGVGPGAGPGRGRGGAGAGPGAGPGPGPGASVMKKKVI